MQLGAPRLPSPIPSWPVFLICVTGIELFFMVASRRKCHFLLFILSCTFYSAGWLWRLRHGWTYLAVWRWTGWVHSLNTQLNEGQSNGSGRSRSSSPNALVEAILREREECRVLYSRIGVTYTFFQLLEGAECQRKRKTEERQSKREINTKRVYCPVAIHTFPEIQTVRQAHSVRKDVLVWEGKTSVSLCTSTITIFLQSSLPLSLLSADVHI